MAVIKSSVTVGHIPWKISSVCPVFLRRGDRIRCLVTGSRRFSTDLPQGGLEVPCLLIFEGREKDVAKAKRLVQADFTVRKADSVFKRSSESEEYGRECTTRRLNSDKDSFSSEMESSTVNGDKLSDLHINFAQQLLKKQFPEINGLHSTLLQSKAVVTESSKPTVNNLQIVHDRGDHWIVAFNIGCEKLFMIQCITHLTRRQKRL